ncbi:hypothetical protein [Actinoplanes couchii]|uniref:hypothetical protein n=1 Tax=Actinoplanes couchii TaxID=403638 RepID=UPI001EF1C601|nr:hypothetical protein [Actinoplanes couchii]MDR6324503.1 hypothetical protein [Actinoplanes couchii]
METLLPKKLNGINIIHAPQGFNSHTDDVSEASVPAETLQSDELARPTVADALVMVHRTHGSKAAAVWQRLLADTGLAGHETDDDSLRLLLTAMADHDPVSKIRARALLARLSSFNHIRDRRPYAARSASHEYR